MAFTAVCPKDAVAEGGMGLFQVGKKSVLLVWPQGGELKAYRGRCPHADMPLADGCFDGQRVVCHIHQWGYDAGSGKCVSHAHRRGQHAAHPRGRPAPWTHAPAWTSSGATWPLNCAPTATPMCTACR
ncbi:Rieske 2Fe-2S domain-containing protein [Ideonella dechloratans]|uniref:Rieske 2Fe-2S domain-containing protein n=1 Tax=Ideonella dechloratans TaxID=36863 RepID=UPI0035B24BE3